MHCVAHRTPRGGTAAVAVHCSSTTERLHNLSNLFQIHTGGIRRLTAVVLHNHDRAVFLDSHDGTGSGVGGVVLGVLIHTILDQEAEVGRNDLLFPAGDGRGSGADLGLGNAVRADNAVLLIKA